MSGKKITYYSLIAFILGAVILAYVQYDSNKSINALIGGNESLLDEFAISNQLKTLEKDVLTVESKTRGHITTGNIELGEGLESKLRDIKARMAQLHKSIDDEESRKHLSVLDSLIDRKLEWNEQLYTTYYQHGKDSAISLIATQRGRHLTDSIAETIATVDTTRQEYMRAAITSVDDHSETAKSHNLILIVSLLVGAAIFFWYTIRSARKQSKLIHELNISERKVKESVLIKERFLANMSHEIRTPLNAILGFINLLQKKPLDTESAEYVDTIRRSGENLLNIVNDILDLSKIEAHMMHIESAPFSLRGLIHSVQHMFFSKSIEKDVTVTAEIDTSLPDILEGDATKLTQILVNLIGNALKFTHGGNITIRVTNEGLHDGLVRTGIAISDTGIGIAADKLEHIFERFRQAEDSMNRHYGGTGLGLTIVNELVSLQKGTISVESEPGKGATFRVMIPYKVAVIQDESESATLPLPATDFTAIKLLVAEDNEINQKLIKHLFRNWNLAYDLASNGVEAIELIKTNRYDMVLMDIQMPEMDGYTAAQHIREQLHISTPIIAMTAHAFAGEREKCLSYGMNDYISKPIKEDKLHDLIAKFAAVEAGSEIVQPQPILNAEGYRFIALGYLKEISGGDTEYEKSIMAVFLEQLPKDLQGLKTAWDGRDLETVKKVAHHLKTTISIVELNATLQPALDAVEYTELTEDAMAGHIDFILATCQGALQEAEDFYNTL